jgi:hypothetical protein
MTNTDCLDGLRCPSCGADNAVHIEPSISDDYAIDEECRCAACGHTGIIGEFDVKEQKAEALHAAAPDLLAALEAQEMAEADPEASLRKGYFDRARELRKAALAKAKSL